MAETRPRWRSSNSAMPLMKMKTVRLILATALAVQLAACAQTNVPGTNAAAVVPAPHVNAGLVPAKHLGGRTDFVIARAQAAPGDYDIEFIGDSITQGWERAGSNTWNQFYGQRKVINMGVSGDRTEHVLWRFEHGQLDGIKAKVAVVMIGTNNSGKNKDGTDTLTAQCSGHVVASRFLSTSVDRITTKNYLNTCPVLTGSHQREEDLSKA